MKKSFLAFITLMACMCFVTSCSSDDDEEASNFEYVEPCLNWDSDIIEVQTYQSQMGSGWKRMLDEEDEYPLSYYNLRYGLSHMYAFDNDKRMCKAVVQYGFYTPDTFRKIQNYLKSNYDAVFDIYEYAGMEVYKAIVVINGHRTIIELINYSNQFTIVSYTDDGVEDIYIDDEENLQGLWKSTRIMDNDVEINKQYYIEFKGNKAKSNFTVFDENYTFVYENGLLIMKNDIGRITEFNIIRFSAKLLEVSYVDDIFGHKVVIKFEKCQTE